MPPESGQHELGEFMGGQMKGKFWGYVPPGNPEAAAVETVMTAAKSAGLVKIVSR